MDSTNLTSVHPLAHPFTFETTKEPEWNVLLVHGFTASPTEVEPLGKYLFQKSQREGRSGGVHSLLLPGHGVAGEEGYKAMDHVTYRDWIAAYSGKVTELTQDRIPLILGGLSMGATLTVQYLATHRSELKDQQIIGAILLSPALALQSKLLNLIGLVKHFVRYQDKGQDTAQFFLQHNLFSYVKRPTSAVHELKKLIDQTKPLVGKVNVPVSAHIGKKDELISVGKVLELLRSIPQVSTNLYPDLDHIFTVDPNAELVFKSIYDWLGDIAF